MAAEMIVGIKESDEVTGGKTESKITGRRYTFGDRKMTSDKRGRRSERGDFKIFEKGLKNLGGAVSGAVINKNKL